MAAPYTATAQYTLTSIAELPPTPAQFVQSPAINNLDQSLFMHESTDTLQGVSGLFRTSRASNRATTLVRNGFVDARSHSLNDLGQAVYIADDLTCVTDGHSTSLVIGASSDPESFTYAPAINNRGAVATALNLDEDGNTALLLLVPHFVGKPMLYTISTSQLSPLNYHSPPALDSQDRVAFSAYSGETLTTDVYAFSFAERGVRQIYQLGLNPSVSNGGTLVFTRLDPGTGETTILRGDITGTGGESNLTPIAQGVGQFTSVLGDAVNDAGQVAFRADLPDGGLATCVGDGSTTAVLVRTGDTVFGRVVTNLSAASINNQAKLAFEAFFSDGSAAIVRADP